MPHAMPTPRNRLQLLELIHLRWVATGLQAGLALAAALGGPPEDALIPAGVALFVAASNGALVAWSRREPTVREAQMAGVLVLDVAALTVGLALWHGTFNPFTALYVVYVVIGAMVLSWPGAATVAALCVGGYALLFAIDRAASGSGGHEHHGGGDAMTLHLAGMWVAFAVAAPFVVYAIARVRRAIANYEDQLAEARARSERNDKLAALATLSAGAAHELGTPLGTIAIAAKELQDGAGDPVADGRLIVEEVDRCREIVHQLAARSAQGFGEAPEDTTVQALVLRACRGLEVGTDVLLELGELAGRRLRVPEQPLARALRGLVVNGLDASDDDRPVVVCARDEDHRVILEIVDRGHGIPDEVRPRIGEPFFTTKGTDGMGLGVYFARSVLDHLGGTVEFRTGPDGTTVEVALPARPAMMEATR